MLKKLKQRAEGFTIIEVLIVLAIAALIMLIVFLAIPALQRNSRNTQRNSDGARILSSVNECLNNHNYDTGSCNSVGEIGFDADEMAILKTNPNFAAGTGSLTGTNVQFDQRCNDDGSVAAQVRSIAVTYQLEVGGGTDNKCASS